MKGRWGAWAALVGLRHSLARRVARWHRAASTTVLFHGKGSENSGPDGLLHSRRPAATPSCRRWAVEGGRLAKDRSFRPRKSFAANPRPALYRTGSEPGG